MTLNHDTGQMEGQVLDGAYKGKQLSDLELAELLELLDECARNDAQSAAILEAYLDSSRGDAWREGSHANGREDSARARSGGMNAEEAREVLGVEADASHQQITEAHRRLMQKLHPDRGGSTYLAAKINEAKRTLLARVSHRDHG
jgi:DnaJ-domain-containing protein 1